MVQRKLFLDVRSHGVKPENRFSNLTTSQELKKKMKRTRPTRLRDTVSQPGKPPPVLDHEAKTKTKTMMATTPPPPLKQSVIKVTDGSPNYMKGTSSSEARRESVPRHVRVCSDIEILRGNKKSGTKLSGSGSGSGIEKQSRSLCRNSSLKMTKTPSFKRCSRIGRCSDVNAQRATCSSTLKDSKFPEYLMLSPGGTEGEGTSVFKVCPYTYCSLNGHLHAQYPPLKSFISARRRALKSQRSTKVEASSPRKENPPSLVGEEIMDSSAATVSLAMQEKGTDGFVEIYVAQKKESEQENGGIMIDFSGKPEEQNGFSGETDGQVSESLSDGAPRSEIDSEEGFGFYHDVFATKTDPNESFAAEKDEKEYPSLWPQAEAMETGTSEEMEWEGDYFKRPGVGSVDDIGLKEAASEDWFDSSDDETEETAEVDEGQVAGANSLGISISFLLSEDSTVGSPVANENIIQTVKAAEMEDSLSSEAKGDAGDADRDESDKDFIQEIEEHNHLVGKTEKQAQDLEEPDEQRMYGFGLTEESQETGEAEDRMEPDRATEENFCSPHSKNIQGVETEKIAFARASKLSNQDQVDDCNKWIIKCKKASEEAEDLRPFNPREPNYLPIVPEPDAEKVDLKHQDTDDRKNTEEWMIDYALQRAVSKLGPARKRKVALLVEAFEAVIPVPKCQTHVTEPSTPFACGRPLQACN